MTMKLFKNKEFSPDEDIQDVYGPPPDEPDPDDPEAPVFVDKLPPMDFDPREQQVQLIYGPPEMFNGGFMSVRAAAAPVAPTDRSNYDKIVACRDMIAGMTDIKPKVALILGSGLGDFAENCVDIRCTVDYSRLPGFPISTVEGHKGRFIFGYIGDVPVVVMQGRVHYYEGYSMQDVVMPTRLMAMLGAKVLFLTNASGGINTSFKAGDFMLITDHISSFVPNPLIGKNIDSLGTRFPDMSEIYDRELRGAVEETAAGLGIDLKHGVYVQLTGPSFESPAEIRMLKVLGADAVGMSTSMEAVTGRHAGMRVCGISCISNLASGLSENPLSHAEVQECANKAAPRFRALVSESIKKFGELLK